VVTWCTAVLDMQPFYIQPKQCICVFFTVLKTKTIFSLYSINWLVFVTKVECVYYAVRTGSLSKIQLNFFPVHKYWHLYITFMWARYSFLFYFLVFFCFVLFLCALLVPACWAFLLLGSNLSAKQNACWQSGDWYCRNYVLPVRTSQTKQFVTIIKTSQLMLMTEIIALYCESRRKYINAL